MARKLKVNKRPRKNVLREIKWIPSLRLEGDWLVKAGIMCGSMVNVEIVGETLLISKL